MNSQKFAEGFISFSQYVTAYIINVFYVLLFVAPLYLVDLLTKESIDKLPLLFIPLVSLILISIKGFLFASYRILIKKNTYFDPAFWQSVKSNFFRDYFYYIVVFGLLYLSVTSLGILSTLYGQWLKVFSAIIIFAFVSNIIYSTIQMAFYEKVSFVDLTRNSLILTIMFGIISVGMTIILSYISATLISRPVMLIMIGAPLIAVLLLAVYQLINTKISQFVKEKEEIK